MLQVAIIGTGNISHAHIQAYLRFPERVRMIASGRRFGDLTVTGYTDEHDDDGCGCDDEAV